MSFRDLVAMMAERGIGQSGDSNKQPARLRCALRPLRILASAHHRHFWSCLHQNHFENRRARSAVELAIKVADPQS
jgi:hypothetical protein